MIYILNEQYKEGPNCVPSDTILSIAYELGGLPSSQNFKINSMENH